ncbi:MAG: hypothetical protein COC09_04410 [Gammaproteobacteria bacterium]|nr:MAG: hypothetical protein COC09_04410 [Gammaproteobacteria bacterium]
MTGCFVVISNIISGTVTERSGEDLIAKEVAHQLESVRELNNLAGELGGVLNYLSEHDSEAFFVLARHGEAE